MEAIITFCMRDAHYPSFQQPIGDPAFFAVIIPIIYFNTITAVPQKSAGQFPGNRASQEEDAAL